MKDVYEGLKIEYDKLRMWKVKHIVSFSGGKDSTAMLLMMIEKGMQIDDIVCADTGLEFPQLYEHIKKVEKYISRKITMLYPEKPFEFYLSEYKIKNESSPNFNRLGLGWAGHKYRWCTGHLKLKQINNYLKGKDCIEYIGIAVDERWRTNRPHHKTRNFKYPLIEWEITEKEALQYCYDRGFDWGGLYNKFKRVSCYCCPLQSLNELRALYKHYPELWENMMRLDKRQHRSFRSDYTLTQLAIKFKAEQNQTNLFEETKWTITA